MEIVNGQGQNIDPNQQKRGVSREHEPEASLRRTDSQEPRDDNGGNQNDPDGPEQIEYESPSVRGI